MSIRRIVPVALVLAVAVAGLTAAPASPSAVRVPGLVPSWAVPASSLGALDESRVVEIEVILPWRDPAAVRRFVASVSDPSSPAYGAYLTPAAFRERFSPLPATVRAVQSWLRAAGLELGTPSLNRVVVPARGPARIVEKAFGTTLARYRVGSLALYAPVSAPALPATFVRLGATVRGLAQTHALMSPEHPVEPALFANPAAVSADPPPAIPQTPPNAADTTPPSGVIYPQPCSAYDGEKTEAAAPALDGRKHPAVQCATSVASLRAAYGLDALIKARTDGAGQTIVMVGSHAMRRLPDDLAEWSRRNKLPALRDGQIAQFSYPGAYETPSDPLQTVLRPQVWAVQSAMLIETMRALAPGANYLYVGSTSSLDLANATLLAVDRHLGEVIVNGWYAASESLTTPADTAPIDRAGEQAAATGISVLFASGDLGDNSGFNATQTGEAESPGSVGGGRINPGEPVPSATLPTQELPVVRVPNIPVVPAHASVSFPAHNPMVTAVGSTSLLTGRGGAYVREIGWAKTHRVFEDGRWQDPVPTTFRGSGGGTSQIYRQPDYQRTTVPGHLAVRQGDGLRGRTVPDVAINGDAETGMLIGYTQRFQTGVDELHQPTYAVRYSERRINANTASTAAFGAVLALANQKRGVPVGFANPLLYGLRSSAYRDITMLGGPVKAGVRKDYLNGSSGKTRYVLKTFEQFTSNVPRPGYDTNTGLGSPSRSFVGALVAARPR